MTPVQNIPKTFKVGPFTVGSITGYCVHVALTMVMAARKIIHAFSMPILAHARAAFVFGDARAIELELGKLNRFPKLKTADWANLVEALTIFLTSKVQQT